MPPEGPIPNVTLVAFPMWVITVFIVVNVILAALVGFILWKFYAIINEAVGMVQDMRKDAMPPVLETLKHVESISADVAQTTHKAPETVDRVTGMVGAVVARTETPAVKAAGLLSGVLAGARAVRSVNKKSDDGKKGGKRGLFR